MNKYETVLIMNNEITKEQRGEIIDRIEKYIQENGIITNTTDLGSKKLAYKIVKQEIGYYYAIEFKAESDAIYELERIYRITNDILKFITIKKDY